MLGAVALAAALAIPAHAKGAAVPTITLNEANPALGDTVTFTLADVPNKNKGDWRIHLECRQPGHDSQSYAVLAPQLEDTFVLGTLIDGSASQWAQEGGPATCTADLKFWERVTGPYPDHYATVATTTFEATG